MIANEYHAPNTRIGRQLQSNGWFKLAEILILFIIGMAGIQLITPLAAGDPLYLQIGVMAINLAMLLYIWIGLRLRGRGWKDLGLSVSSISWKQALRTFLLTLLVTVAGLTAFLLGGVIMSVFADAPEAADMSGYSYFRDNPGLFILVLAGVYLSSSFGEEVIYRGFLITRIAELGRKTKNATILAVIISSAIFGIIHYTWGPMGMVQTGFMGLAMGICYIWLKKRLWILIIAHAYMDTVLLVQVYMASKG